jgi:signal transduction histidine kinase
VPAVTRILLVRILRAVIAPLVRRSTYRRLAFLLLGSAAGYGFTFVGTMLLLVAGPLAPGSGQSGPAGLELVVQVAGPFLLPIPLVMFIGGLRSTVLVQRLLARVLLGVPPGELPADAGGSFRSRWRSGVFFVLHVLAGYGMGILVLFLGGVAALTFLTFLEPNQATLTSDPDEARQLGPLLVAGLALAVPYTAAGLGSVFGTLARRLLGATAAERLAALQHRVHDLAEHNRLARELHDSVGHALSVVAVQASAAQRVLDKDPVVARAALAAISDSARRALADLDHVLALLREEPPAVHPQWTLENLDQLLGDLRAAGLTVQVHRSGDFTAVPAVVSREAYRIVQEGLTNALRHAGPVPVTLWLRSDGSGLEVEISNPLPAAGILPASTVDAGGRGLTGIRERVTLLGGDLAAGPAGERWRVSVRVPLISPAAG